MSPRGERTGRRTLSRWACLAALLLPAWVAAAPVAEPVLSWHRQRPGAIEPLASVVPRGAQIHTGPLPIALSRRPFHQDILKAARKAGIDPALVHAVIGVESAYDAKAVSPKGAVGLMQVIPGTALRYGVDDLLNPRANIRAGTQYLSHLMRLFEGDVRLALAAYNAGEHAVLRHGRRIPPYPETRGYVPRVLGIYEALAAQGRREAAAAGVRPE